MILRPRQLEFVEKSRAALEEFGNTLGVAPTGCGKTVMLSHLAGKSQSSLILQHRDELVDQNRRTFKAVNPSVQSDVFNAERKRFVREGATFAMVQTLCREQNLKLMRPVDLLVIDEAHHVAAESYGRIIEQARELNPEMHIFGVTATPMRGDRKALRSVFSNVSDVVQLSELIAAGHLVRPRCFVIDCGMREELRNVRKTISDFDMGEVESIMDKSVVNEKVLEEWWKLAGSPEAGSRQSVFFCSTVAHAGHVMQTFQDAGIICALVTGETTAYERAAVLKDYDSGEIQCLFNVAVLTEGWDHQPTSCVVLLRPCSYKSTMTQMIGRGLRRVDPERYPGIIKDDCIAEGQRVLTDSGLVPIEKVTLEMKVWDGVAFVAHDGIQFRGTQETICYNGLIATEDHKVWTSTGWKKFGECANEKTDILATGDGGTPIKQSDSNFRSCNQARGGEKDTPNDDCSMPELRRRRGEGFGYDQSRNCRMPQVREDSQHGQASAGCSELAATEMRYGEAALHEQKEQADIQGLRGQRDQILIPFSELYGSLVNAKLQGGSQPSDRQDRQQRALRAGESKNGSRKGESEQPAQELSNIAASQIQSQLSDDKVFGCDPSEAVFGTHEAKPNSGQISAPVFKKTKRRVWDILNAGPRHRFTCEGLLVSNCIVLDFGYSLLTHGDLETDIDLDPQKGKGEAPTKECPSCGTLIPAQTMLCPICGHVFEKEEEEVQELREFILTEVDILNMSPYRWEKLWEPVSLANGMDAWAAVIAFNGRFHAVGCVEGNGGVHVLANAPTKIEALSVADDYLRAHGNTDAARKSKSWLSAPMSEKQMQILGVGPMEAMGTSRYRASCQITWRFNERAIRAKLQGQPTT